MNILSIGSKITLRKISEEIVDKVESINFLDTTTNNFLNWGLSKTKKINYYSGDITKIDTLINAGLNHSDIIIVHSENDMESLFIAQKSKINVNSSIFVILEDLSLAEIFESLGFIIFDSHNLKITRLLNKLGN
tara:strand:+ start:602 stop:1003 length:402 start_codon:yes stop_codon:yes gene_type:complete